jgi:hypothetical protein
LHAPDPNEDSETDPALSEDTIGRLRAGFSGRRCFLLVGADATGPLRLARKVMSNQGAPLIEADVAGLVKGGEDAVVMLLGEARFRRAGIYLDKIEALAKPEVPPTFTRRLLQLLSRVRIPVFLRAAWNVPVNLHLDISRSLEAVEIQLSVPDPDSREAIWRNVLTEEFGEETATQVAHVARAYPFGVGEIHRAMEIARLHAQQRNQQSPELRPTDVETGCNTLSGQHIGALATRVRVLADWDDVVLTEATRGVIDDILRFGQYRDRVFNEHGYGTKMSYGRGLTSLFWGPPGTGKTLVSGLIARELGLELYRIDLSQVVSKYIGETEERLAQLFDEADRGGMALLFDEADSMFSKRTQVKSSTDRYANLEVNYLLQRLENHEGVVILTTNFRAAIDTAFMRRIRFKAEFPMPEAAERATLWEKMIPPGAPQDKEIRFDALGEVWELAGGGIRNAVLRAAFYAAEEAVPVGLAHLDRGAEKEYREAGHLVGNKNARAWLKKRTKAPKTKPKTPKS